MLRIKLSSLRRIFQRLHLLMYANTVRNNACNFFPTTSFPACPLPFLSFSPLFTFALKFTFPQGTAI